QDARIEYFFQTQIQERNASVIFQSYALEVEELSDELEQLITGYYRTLYTLTFKVLRTRFPLARKLYLTLPAVSTWKSSLTAATWVYEETGHSLPVVFLADMQHPSVAELAKFHGEIQDNTDNLLLSWKYT